MGGVWEGFINLLAFSSTLAQLYYGGGMNWVNSLNDDFNKRSK